MFTRKFWHAMRVSKQACVCVCCLVGWMINIYLCVDVYVHNSSISIVDDVYVRCIHAWCAHIQNPAHPHSEEQSTVFISESTYYSYIYLCSLCSLCILHVVVILHASAKCFMFYLLNVSNERKSFQRMYPQARSPLLESFFISSSSLCLALHISGCMYLCV